VISVLQLGIVAYAEALELQRALVERRKAGAISDVLLLLEHPPVITLGRNAKEKNVIASRDALAARGVELFECDRGGDVTYHGPGQLVGYPIFDLRGFTDDHGHRRTLWPVEFVRLLEEVLIASCEQLGVKAKRVAALTGVWTNSAQPAKLAAIGVHISRGVTSHGFALNVNNDLDAFKLIIPCGIADKPVTSLARELGKELSVQAVAEIVASEFAPVFHRKLTTIHSLEELLGVTPQDVPLQVPREIRRLRRESEVLLS
jgi:lipoyl(octanoyl) transferase